MRIFDAHNDFLTTEKNPQKREKIVEDFLNCKAKLISCAIFTTEIKPTIKQIFDYSKQIKKYNEKYNGNFLLSFEDLGFLKNELSELINLRPISATLGWNWNNQFIGGALDNGGLTKLGKQTIVLLEKNNIFVDCAHMNRKSFYQFIKISKKPIYCSHSNVNALHRHKRNLTNNQIKKIVETNGYLGITIYQDFISNKKISSKDIAKQFHYLIQHFGYNNFGFGTDFYGIDRDKLPTDISNYKDLNNIKIWLKRFGYKDSDIQKLFYKNYQNFLTRNGLL